MPALSGEARTTDLIVCAVLLAIGFALGRQATGPPDRDASEAEAPGPAGHEPSASKPDGTSPRAEPGGDSVEHGQSLLRAAGANSEPQVGWEELPPDARPAAVAREARSLADWARGRQPGAEVVVDCDEPPCLVALLASGAAPGALQEDYEERIDEAFSGAGCGVGLPLPGGQWATLHCILPTDNPEALELLAAGMAGRLATFTRELGQR